MSRSIPKLGSGFSFKEKSILISLIAVSAIYGGYFFDVLTGASGQSLSGMLQTMLGIVIALVVVHVIFHIVIALDDVDQAEDERDRAVARRASVFGYNVLLVAVLAIIGRTLILGARAEAGSLAAPPDSIETVNLLLAGLVLSEIVYYGTQLLFYRRGVYG
jgi:hypothetical protein